MTGIIPTYSARKKTTVSDKLLDNNIRNLESEIDTLRTAADLQLDVLIQENRDFTASEKTEFFQTRDQILSKGNRLVDLRRVRDTEGQVSSYMREFDGGQGMSEGDEEIAERFRKSALTRSLGAIEIELPKPQRRSGFQPGIERRAIATSSGSGLTGKSFWSTMQTNLVESSAILKAGATVIQTDTGESLLVPRSSAFSSAGRVAEGALIPESDPTLGTVQFDSYKYAFIVQVTAELARDAKFDLVGYLAKEAGIAIGNGFGAEAVTGTGTGQPMGALTGATVGITGPTGTATSFGSHTTVGQGGDLLLDLASSLAEPYARSDAAAWMMRTATLNTIRKLRDSTGKYVFDTDIIPGSGSAGTLLGRPVYLDPNMPAMGANNQSILFGDFSRYWVRQVASMRFEPSIHYGFDHDLISYRAIATFDGHPIDVSALKSFKHSAT